MQAGRWGILLCTLALLCACPAAEDGSISGTISPLDANIRITAIRQGTEVATADIAADGHFLLSVPPGTYEVRISVPAAPFPTIFPAVSVRSRETTDLGEIKIILPKGDAALRGSIMNATTDTTVALLAEGTERAAVHAGADGSYRFEQLLPDTYTIRVHTPGYADESTSVTLRERQTVRKDFRQLYITAIEGADWTKGILRSRGVGLPPPQAPSPTVRREMAKRAALADAERNMLRLIELVHVGPEKKLLDLLGEKNFQVRLQGYLKGYTVVADRDLNGGRVEIEIELPLTGQNGLSSYVHER